MKFLTCLALLFALVAAPAHAQNDQARWQAQASRVTITRDDWGIAHVHGRSDADAVFGAIYAQAEDDFPRIEANLLTALGRTAEAEGESAIWQDLRQRLWIDPAELQADYRRSPDWLRALMDAWADGLNYYLAIHPETRPSALTRFEPWMALSFTEGSIGGDIERVDLRQLAAFYGGQEPRVAAITDDEPRGSNGIAIAPRLTRDGHALLLINPHTSFFFRAELGMRSDEGLNAYGASTWGQFFIYQGFNDRVGWMHTSSGVDVVDEFVETVGQQGAQISYRYGNESRPVETRAVTLRIRQPDGSLAERAFTTYRTHHGPIVRAEGDRWVAMALMHRPIPALQQSWLRTKARNFAGYMEVAALQANSSNDTIYADADGHITYLHPQFVPVRDDRFDYTNPVDGSDPATDWRGLTPIDRLPTVRDPRGHWLYNANDAPWRAAGPDSPRQADFPRYMDSAGDNPRGDHATALLGEARALTPEGLRQIAYSNLMPFFPKVIPSLVEGWRALPARDPLRTRLAGAVDLLRAWDSRWSAGSEATTLANFWAEEMRALATRQRPSDNLWAVMEAFTPREKLDALARAVDTLERDWGRWHVPWGEVNRFQRNDGAIAQTFDDSRPSIPVPFASARWGTLASFGARAYPGTRRWYGTSGNSFVAIVEFGPRVRAWAVSAGGESGNPASPHFNDQAARYAAGDLRPVYFHPEDLEGHVARTYRPGE
ncbi:penicillin acylase family protein [Sphingosinicella sp. LHD-64]|uniref:penicillin acylase family protein n=1 Tax=Sphingosinicella sp. LHD-64 TaxID=3072139 RepID=UPI00280F81FB|nr:penicillin acylase family protein [Sphingosinicella sp. LHD-64]MDQ8754771.1 penicillin acylase family protein [Sphingosinicella sp. LHD-64]